MRILKATLIALALCLAQTLVAAQPIQLGKPATDRQLRILLTIEEARKASKQGHYDKAVKLAKPAARGGNVQAQFLVGIWYWLGAGVTASIRRIEGQGDVSKAAYWLQEAAKKGHGEAQAYLGVIYAEGGWNLELNRQVAMYWLRKAEKNPDNPEKGRTRALISRLETTEKNGGTSLLAPQLSKTKPDATRVKETGRISSTPTIKSSQAQPAVAGPLKAAHSRGDHATALTENPILSFLGLAVVLISILWIVTGYRLLALRQSKEAEIETLKSDAKTINDKIQEYRVKFAPTFDQEAAVARLKAEEVELANIIEVIRKSYGEKRSLLEKLETQLSIYDDRLAFAELGIYEPHFDFTDSEAFKERIREVRNQQKEMVSAKIAILCPTEWTVDGSTSKGQTMINRQMRLSLRAFNNECDAAISNTRWNNVVAMEKRILAAEKAINRENSSMMLTINEAYVRLKIEELRLTHEYREQQKVEKEEHAELKRAEREEQKLLAEAAAAEKEERKYQALLDNARKEVGADKARIAELEVALAEAQATSERARAMAEMTKSGYVYIISNVGSFGEDVVKIGLTRRLEPDDRVRELGDASVPFRFDTHAMIYSDEAPALEAALHKEFAARRINMSNMRKEFFRVGLEEVESAVTRLAPEASFFKDREAREWHETLAKRNQMLVDMQTAADRFPQEI